MRRFDLTVTCACCALLGYFAWHAWQGPRGYPYQEGLEAEVATLTQKYEAQKSQKDMLEQRVALLRPESIDPDMLDEMARQNLDLARPNELVVFTDR